MGATASMSRSTRPMGRDCASTLMRSADERVTVWAKLGAAEIATAPPSSHADTRDANRMETIDTSKGDAR